MVPLYLAAAILAGMGSSQRMGEVSPFAVAAAEVSHKAFVVEAGWDSADKVENRSGWSLRGAGDWHCGFLTLGAGYSYRRTSEWSKDAWWARAGVQSGPLWLIASIAPDSRNMEAKLEARLRLRHRWAIVEPRAWVGTHSTAEELGGYSYGVDILMGAAR